MIIRFALLLLFVPIASAQSDELAAQSRRAKALMGAGQFQEAIPIYTQLVKALPGNPGLLLNLALAQHMAGRDREAIPNFETVLKAQPKLLPALVSLGASRLALNEPRQAIAPLRRAVLLDPANQDARGMLAGALLETKDFAEAAGHYRKLTETSVDDPRAWNGLGKSYEALAASAFERLQKLDPQSPYIAALVAGTRVARGQYRSAFFFYNEALKKLPNLHGIHSAMAGIYRKTGHPDWAAVEDAKEQALPPADCAAHPVECQFAAGQHLRAATPAMPAKVPPEALFWQAQAANELARQAFGRLGQLPPSVELHQLRAGIAREQNHHLESVREWRAALELAPGNPRLRYELAVALFLAQDFKSALAEATALLGGMPRSAELNFVAGDSLLRLEEPEKAVPYLRAAIAADPSLVAARASLGLSLFRLGQAAEALPNLEKSLELDEDGSLHFQLARAYQALGETAKSRAAMAKYQEILKRNQEAAEEVTREAQIGPPRQ